MQAASESTQPTPDSAVFLPDLCGVVAVLAVVIVSELVALTIVIAGAGSDSGFFNRLALVSLYCQWLGLSVAGVLCLSRKPLARLREHAFGQRSIALISYLLVVLVSWVVAELAWWVVNPVVGAGALINLSHFDLVVRTIAITAMVGALVLR